MSGSNGELEGTASLWRDEAEPVPLLGSGAADELSPHLPNNGDERQAPAIAERPSFPADGNKGWRCRARLSTNQRSYFSMSPRLASIPLPGASCGICSFNFRGRA